MAIQETNDDVQRSATNGQARSRSSLAYRMGEIAEIPLSQIVVPDGWNVRSPYVEGSKLGKIEDEKVAALAEGIRAEGLLTPLTVAPLPPDPATGEPRYGVCAGYRRHRALTEFLKLRGSVRCTVKTFKTAWGAALLNVSENTQREDLRAADIAKRFHELLSGTYPRTDSNDLGEPVPLKTIALESGKSDGYIRHLATAWKKLSGVLREAWRELDVPTDIAIAWGRLPEDEQFLALEEWTKAQERDQKRAIRDRATKRAEDEESGGGGTSAGATDEGKPKPRTASEIRTYLDKLQAKLDGPRLPARDQDVINAKVEALEWAEGRRKRLTLT